MDISKKEIYKILNRFKGFDNIELVKKEFDKYFKQDNPSPSLEGKPSKEGEGSQGN